ncbi:MAG: rhodanese-like domain-containing protein [Desulfopila sp.]
MLFSNWRNLWSMLTLSLLTIGWSASTTMAAQQDNVYTGSIVGKSNRAKTISISVGKGEEGKTMMVKFDDETTGLNYAEQGEAAIITWQQRGDERFATEIKPKLAKLPPGVTEIKVDEIATLIDDEADMVLIDARPEMRFAQGHLPGAISIPVAKLQQMEARALPTDHERLLIFYCGGPT